MSNPNVPAKPDADLDFKAAMIKAGFMTPSMGGSTINRVKITGSNIVSGDGEILGSYNAKTKEPALYVQLLDTPIQYQGLWFDKDGRLANAVGRPNIAGHFCKSHFDNPAQARKYAEDGTSCEGCPVNPYKRRDELPPEAIDGGSAKKCQWRGEVEFRVLDKQEDGSFAANDEMVYTLSLSTTGMIEFVGSNSKKADPMRGSVSEQNTNVRLAMLGMSKWGDDGVRKAADMLRLGGVIAEFRILPAENKENNWNYSVPSFNPIDILEVTEQPALETSDGTAPDSDPLPF